MPGTDVSKYHNCRWVSIEGAAHANPIVDPQIKQASDAQLALKGLRKTTGDSADLCVAYEIAVDEEKQYGTPMA